MDRTAPATHDIEASPVVASSGLADLNQLRPRLTSRVVDLLVRSGPLDRRALAELLGVSRPALARSVIQLLDAGMLVESLPRRTHQQRGRPTSLLRVNPGAANAVGVHFGTRKVRAIVVDAAHTVIAAREHRCPGDYDTITGAEIAATVIEELAGHATGPVIGVGVASPGSWYGRSRDLPSTVRQLPDPATPDLVELLTRRSSYPVVADEECRLAAYAEWQGGFDPKPDSMVYLRLHSRVGGALIMQGRLVHGQHGRAGEFGHLGQSRGRPGGRCRCGNNGCLETIIGIPALLSATAAVIGPSGTFADLVGSVRAGERLSVRTVAEAGREAGHVLATLCNAVDPAVGVIGGALLQLPELLLDAIREGFDATALPAQRQLPIRAAQLGRFAAAHGATTLLFQAGFDALLHADHDQPHSEVRRIAAYP